MKRLPQPKLPKWAMFLFFLIGITVFILLVFAIIGMTTSKYDI